MNIFKKLVAAFGLLTLATACTEPKPTQTVYLLLDTSGTYTKELKKAQQVINYYLGTLNAGDSLAVARIDSGSFSEKDIVAKSTFDLKPSVANQQKRHFVETINDFVKGVKSSSYTDIKGGMLQGTEYIEETGANKKVILIYSDLKQELPNGYKRDFDLNLSGYDVYALNVTKLRSDNVDPKEYLARIDYWKSMVEQSGGQFHVINDMDREGALALN